MENFSPEEQQTMHAELTGGESLLWSGRPNRSVIFHPSDWYMDGLYLNSGVPVFVDIDDASAVYALVADLRASHATRRS